MNNIKLIVGLANPGAEYEKTRHNAGAWYIQTLCDRYHVELKPESKFYGLTGKLQTDGFDARLLIPTTFMNLSGKSVSAITQFYNIEPSQIVVAHDELDLNPGIAKLKVGGGHGGHNGLKDIINKLGNNPNFVRLRIGIGHPGDKNKVVNFVLNKPSTTEQSLIDHVIGQSVSYTTDLLRGDITRAMNEIHALKP